jgi:hypothetical protein
LQLETIEKGSDGRAYLLKELVRGRGRVPGGLSVRAGLRAAQCTMHLLRADAAPPNALRRGAGLRLLAPRECSRASFAITVRDGSAN